MAAISQCDLNRPSCGQCLRSGRACAGYKELPLRNLRPRKRLQRQKVALESSAKDLDQIPNTFHSDTALKDANAAAHSNIAPENSCTISTFPKNNIPLELSVQVEDRAASYFFNNFMLGSFPRVCLSASEEGAFGKMTTAVGVACLSHTLLTPDMMIDALEEYNKVVKVIIQAINNPLEAARNENVLLTVSLSGIYELLLELFKENKTSAESLDPWMIHITGALAFLELWGEEELRQPVSRHFLRLLRSQCVIHCMLRGEPVPENLIRMSEFVQQFEESDTLRAENEIAVLGAHHCNLQIKIKSSGQSINAEEIVESALKLDTQLEAWGEKWKHKLIFETVVQHSPDIFSQIWHLYSDHLVATLWNSQRCIRIQMHQVIISQLERIKDLYFFPQPRMQTPVSKRIIHQLVEEVMASVPFFFKANPSGLDTMTFQQPIAASRLLIWPLFVVGRDESTSDAMRMAVATQLEKIGRYLEISNATALADVIRSKSPNIAPADLDLG